MTDLSHLPLARLSSEKQVLLVEGSTRGGGIVGDLAAARFGPNGLGLLGYRELGVHRLVEADVESWARERFTTHNAVMWFSGPPPDGFRTELEPGMHIPAPEPTGLPIMSMPAWTYGPQGGVAVSYLGARTSGLAAMAQIATRRANTRLRHERSLSYSVQNVYLPLTSEVAYVTIVADCTEATSARVRDGMLEILFDLAEHGPRVEELQQLAAERRRMTEHPQWAYAELQRLANDAVLGRELESGEGQIAELEAVSPHEARPAFEEALKGLVVMAPSGLDMSSMPFGPIDVLAQPRVSGKSIRLPKDARNLLKARRIELSREGVSLVGDGGDAVTLRFATLSAVLQWPGGRRLLLNYDGTSVDFCPDHFRGGADLIRLIDESVDPTVVVPMDSPPPPH